MFTSNSSLAYNFTIAWIIEEEHKSMPEDLITTKNKALPIKIGELKSTANIPKREAKFIEKY